MVCLAGYELIRRVNVLRVLFGMKWISRKPVAGRVAAPTAGRAVAPGAGQVPAAAESRV